MSLLPIPEVTISDAAVDDALGRAVRVINPLLDVLWGTDPLGLKRRGPGPGDGPLDKVADGFGWVLNAADVPGTLAWDDMDVDARINWWVWRVGALNTVAVAFPGVLGAVGRRLPIQDLLGFASQALVLCAVARELGVSDHRSQVDMLAAVLCDRTVSVSVTPQVSTRHRKQSRAHRWAPRRLCGILWVSSTPSATNSPSARTREHPSAIWGCCLRSARSWTISANAVHLPARRKLADDGWTVRAQGTPERCAAPPPTPAGPTAPTPTTAPRAPDRRRGPR